MYFLVRLEFTFMQEHCTKCTDEILLGNKDEVISEITLHRMVLTH